MLKKILGEAPFDVLMGEDVVISAEKEHKADFVLTNESEYDLPLSCTLELSSFVNADKSAFDVIVPAEGKTSTKITFSAPQDSRLFGGSKICVLEIIDRIFDSRTEYEFTVNCEMAYKCCENKDEAFAATDEILFSRKGMVFANRGEVISLEMPCTQKNEIMLHIISGKIKDFCDGDIISLSQGLNRLCFEMEDDGSFEFLNPQSLEKIYPDTLNPKYFI